MDNTHYTPEEPICAIATALAPAALGIIRCSGKNSIELFSKIFSRPKALLEAKGNTIVYGWVVASTGSANEKAKIDEVLVSVFRNPKSFTGEDSLEISCHGGTAVVSAIFNLLLKSGFRRAEKGEFTFRAFINGKTDLTKAEAVREIIDAKTLESEGRAAGRLSGELYNSIDSVKKLIVDTLASIEVEIEYPEDEETISETFDKNNLVLAEKKLQRLADSWKSEKLYQDGARVVLCGKTNAGKSSLFNALLKEERAIVSDIEGTTRDWIESWVSFSGIPARLFDTAGLRKTEDIIEAKGVEMTRDLSKEADLILYLVDAEKGCDAEDEKFISEAAATRGVPIVVAFNKLDKVASTSSATPAPELVEGSKKFGISSGTITEQTTFPISAKTGEGIGELCDAVKKILLSGSTENRNETGLGSERQKVSVEKALESVRHAIALTEEYTLDAVVQDLEDALDALGEVTGEVTPDDILGSVFSNFCVGK